MCQALWLELACLRNLQDGRCIGLRHPLHLSLSAHLSFSLASITKAEIRCSAE